MTSGHLDDRFSDPAAGAADWGDVETLLRAAELYWLTTVRADGRPHVTPLVGLWHDGAFHFTTGTDEQKSRNLDHSPSVVGHDRGQHLGSRDRRRRRGHRRAGAAASGAGRASRRRTSRSTATTGAGRPTRTASRRGENNAEHDGLVLVYRVAATKVIAFAKDPHAQTTFRF